MASEPNSGSSLKQQVMASTFPLADLFGRVVGCALGHILNLDILLDLKEDVPHLGDFVLHQVLVESVGDL